jgi:hypothetical protein
LLSPGSTLQRLAALADTTAKLIVQLRELNELREQVRKAELMTSISFTAINISKFGLNRQVKCNDLASVDGH